MSRKEVTDLLDKIQAYRQSFLITNAVLNEWSRILEPYDYEDVDKKLDEYFKNGDNFGKYPDVYYLTKYLKKHDEKLKIGVNYINCHLCGKLIDLTKFNEHYERCSSVDYIVRMYKKYYDKNLNEQKLWDLSKEEFDKKYWNFCEKLYERMEDTDRLKHGLKNAILTHYGHDPEYSLEEVIGYD